MLLIGWNAREFRFKQSAEALPRSGWWWVISMEFLRLLLRRRFARAQVATSRNVGCFLRLFHYTFTSHLICTLIHIYKKSQPLRLYEIFKSLIKELRNILLSFWKWKQNIIYNSPSVKDQCLGGKTRCRKVNKNSLQNRTARQKGDRDFTNRKWNYKQVTLL